MVPLDNSFFDFLGGAGPSFGPLAPLMQSAILTIISFVMAIMIAVGLVLLLVSVTKMALGKHDGDPHQVRAGRSGLIWSVILIITPVIYVVVVLAISAAADSL